MGVARYKAVTPPGLRKPTPLLIIDNCYLVIVHNPLSNSPHVGREPSLLLPGAYASIADIPKLCGNEISRYADPLRESRTAKRALKNFSSTATFYFISCILGCNLNKQDYVVM
ncbi:MAG: hypothetical protein ACM3U1_09425, partial [Chloroflexota bacterium]